MNVAFHPLISAATTRRRLLAATIAGIGPALIHAAPAEQEILRTAEGIHQEAVFKAGRKRVYDALTDADQFRKVAQLSAAAQSGMALGNRPVEISRQPGGAFTLFGGHIFGRQIELVPGERIVQAWRVADWKPGVYSIVKIELADQGAGTRLILDHAGFPQGQAQHLAEGWKANYWQPLEKFL